MSPRLIKIDAALPDPLKGKVSNKSLVSSVLSIAAFITLTAEGSDVSEIVGIVFENTYVSDANLWLTNGYTKTSGSATRNLPPICTDVKDRWGILFSF